MGVKEKFIYKYGRSAFLVGLATDFPPIILLVQAALETGWGQKVVGNNLYGIKNLSTLPGSVEFETHEFENGEFVKVVDSFQSYESTLESMIGYISFIRTNERYASAWVLRHDPERYFEALQEAGYATDRLYAWKLKSIYHHFPKDWLEILFGTV